MTGVQTCALPIFEWGLAPKLVLGGGSNLVLSRDPPAVVLRVEVMGRRLVAERDDAVVFGKRRAHHISLDPAELLLAVGEDHAVVAARSDGHWRVLDNRTFLMVEDSGFGKYRPLFAIDAEAHEKAAHDEKLDEDIGVIGGNLGEAAPGQAPPSFRRIHLASLGITESGADSSDGPIQNVDASED